MSALRDSSFAVPLFCLGFLGFLRAHRRIPRTLLLTAAALLAGCLHQYYPCANDCGVVESDRPTFDLSPEVTQSIPALIEAPVPERPPKPGFKHRVSDHLVDRLRSQDLLAYEVGDWRFQSVGENGQPGNHVSFRLYLGKTVLPAPLIVVLPIWGTFDYPSEKLSWMLRRHFAGKVHIAVLGGQNRLVQWQGIGSAESREELLQQARLSATHVDVTAEDIRALFRWARAQSFVDADRLLLAGFSIGAIVGSVTAIREEPSLLGTMLVLGAGSPAEVMAYCNRIAAQSREAAKNNLGLDQAQYLAMMREAFDGLDWVKQGVRAEDPERYLLIDAARDDCMPQSARDELWQGLGRPERFTLHGNHHGAFLSMTRVGLDYSNRKILDYIDRRLDSVAH